MSYIKCRFLTIVALGTFVVAANPCHGDIWINEFQFNNTDDSNQFIEVLITKDTAVSPPMLASISLELHDPTIGGSASLYDSITMDDALILTGDDAFANYYVWKPASIRNHATGIALIDLSTGTRQFFSWNGTFAAQDGLAGLASLTSTDVGFSQDGTTPVNQSIGLVGVGTEFDDFTWSSPMPYTENAVNVGQSFGTVPEPGSLVLLAAISTIGLARTRRRA